MNQNRKMQLKLGPILVIVTLLALGAAIFFFLKYRQVQQDPSVATQVEAKKIGAKVAALLEVPQDETPSVATVTDKSKLNDQQFFAKSENGDKVVVYYSAGIAVLYRPSIDKIISVSPINVNTPSTSPSPEVSATPSVVQTTQAPTGTPKQN